MHYLLLGMPGLPEMILIAFFGLLIFGKRLPEVGRSIGKGIVEFKKGLKSIDEETDAAANAAPPATSALPPGKDAPKFDPYTGKPLVQQFDPYTGKPVNTETGTSEKQL